MNNRTQSIYLADELNFLIEKAEELKSTLLYGLLRQPELSAVTVEQRDNIISSILELSQDLQVSVKTTQLAISITDSFLAVKSLKNSSVLGLVALVSFSLAVKYEEGSVMTFDMLHNFGNKKYSHDAIATTENYILTTLKWSLNLPTASEIFRILLSYTCENTDLSQLEKVADNYANICYSDWELVKEGPMSIAVVAVLCALDRFGYYEFKQGWISRLQTYMKLELDKLETMVNRVYSNLEDMSRLSEDSNGYSEVSSTY